jgi:hypothetical protein
MEPFPIFCRFFQFSDKFNKFEVNGLTDLALSKGQIALFLTLGKPKKMCLTVSSHAVCEFRVREMAV